MLRKMLVCMLCLTLLVPALLGEKPASADGGRLEGSMEISEDSAPKKPDSKSDETVIRAVTTETGIDPGLFAGLPISRVKSQDVFSEMATAFAMQNDQIDLFIFCADDGLYSVKRHGYYVPLNGSEALMEKLKDFYPAVQRALTNDNGDLVGWPMGGTLFGMELSFESRREQAGIGVPTTFDELLDCGFAILEADVLPAGISILGDYPFTKHSVLDLYMDQYIRASQLEGGVVRFTDPIFVAMAERIKRELPEIDPAFEGSLPYDGLFFYPMGFDTISHWMLPMPQVLPEKAGLVDMLLSVAVVNPYSARREETIAFLETYFTGAQLAKEGARIQSYLFDASLNEPMKTEWLIKSAADTRAAIARLEAAEKLTDKQRDELEELRIQLEGLENSWAIAPEDIEAYASISGGLSILEASPITYDASLRMLAERYLNGAYDAAGFAQACQDHISMIYMENDIPME